MFVIKEIKLKEIKIELRVIRAELRCLTQHSYLILASSLE